MGPLLCEWETGGVLMINTNIYNYVNVLDKAADASNSRNTIIANNIANVDRRQG